MNRTQQLPTRTMFTVFPLRFSLDPPAMAAFLQTLGLSQIIGQPQGSYAVMAAASGRVQLHADSGPRAGRTDFGFEVADARAAADRLRELGLDVTVWDEAYGQHVGIRDYRGGGVTLSEEMTDAYGYQRTAQPRDPADIDVTAVYYTVAFGAARSWFERFGFRSEHPEAIAYDPLRAGERAGVIGLHAVDTDPPLGSADADDPMAPSAAAIHLGFETGQGLPALTERLRQAGYSDARIAEDSSHLTVTDPDGCSIEVFPRSSQEGSE